MTRLCLSLAALLLVAPLVSAQPTRVTMPKLLAVVRPDVQAEIKLSDDQLAKVKEKTGDIVKDGPNGAKFLTITPDTDLDSLDADVEKLLDEKQRKRLKECWLQILGPRAVLHEAIAKEVGLSMDQQKQVADLNNEQREKMREHMSFDGTPPSPETVAKVKSIQNEFKTKIETVLTADQKKKLAGLQGPKFQMKDEKAEK